MYKILRKNFETHISLKCTEQTRLGNRNVTFICNITWDIFPICYICLTLRQTIGYTNSTLLTQTIYPQQAMNWHGIMEGCFEKSNNIKNKREDWGLAGSHKYKWLIYSHH